MQNAITTGLNPTVKARAQFLTWLQKTNPPLYEAGIRAAGMRTSGKSNLGQIGPEQPVAEPAWWQKALTGIGQAAGFYTTYRAQKELIEINIERAKNGLPPIDIAAAGAAPVVKTEIALSDDVMDNIKASFGGMGQNMMLLVGIGLAAFLLFGKK